VQKIIRTNKGIYIIELFAEKDFTISAKKFIGYKFNKGFYYYIGSAQKNLTSRIERHKRRIKNIHWHIDHLTTHPSINITNTFVIPSAVKEIEAEIANNFTNYFNSEIATKGFGNSDTKETITHLFYNTLPINIKEFKKHYLTVIME
jgi:sugar fermentation stimulation protein A